MKIKKCEICKENIQVLQDKDCPTTWKFGCGCGPEGTVIMMGRDTKEQAIEAYNRQLPGLFPQASDVILQIRITKDNKVSTECHTTDIKGWDKRIKKNIKTVLRLVKNYA